MVSSAIKLQRLTFFLHCRYTFAYTVLVPERRSPSKPSPSRKNSNQPVKTSRARAVYSSFERSACWDVAGDSPSIPRLVQR